MLCVFLCSIHSDFSRVVRRAIVGIFHPAGLTSAFHPDLMDQKVTDLSVDISLIGEEEKDVIILTTQLNTRSDHRPTLVGRVLIERSYNFEAMKSTLVKALNPGREMSKFRLADNMFALIFSHPVDLRRTLKGGPWNFDKNLIALNVVKDNQDLLAVNLDLSDFTVYIHDIPHEQKTRNIVAYIRNALGCLRPGIYEEETLTHMQTVKIHVGLNDRLMTSPRTNFAGYSTILRRTPTTGTSEGHNQKGSRIFRDFSMDSKDMIWVWKGKQVQQIVEEDMQTRIPNNYHTQKRNANLDRAITLKPTKDKPIVPSLELPLIPTSEIAHAPTSNTPLHMLDRAPNGNKYPNRKIVSITSLFSSDQQQPSSSGTRLDTNSSVLKLTGVNMKTVRELLRTVGMITLTIGKENTLGTTSRYAEWVWSAGVLSNLSIRKKLKELEDRLGVIRKGIVLQDSKQKESEIRTELKLLQHDEECL
ncbi:hypothetical protein Salat_2440400 [Sesamum alatum]|uniref:DUF4283 domain-containing protein n=1 Tax=Sesamum alatum TaxID=300844 RepID=A0AAE2CFJ7_9LAMI|nr:hypothetical protein Salat_2440400 [Sesamum alatum]